MSESSGKSLGSSTLFEVDDVSAEVTMRMLNDRTSLLVQDLYAEYNKFKTNAGDCEDKVESKKVVRFPYYVSPVQLAFATDVFPVFKFTTAPAVSAGRSCMEVMHYVAVEVMTQVNSWPNETVVCINGSTIVSALRGRGYVHNCLDITDANIHVQFIKDFSDLKRMYLSKKSKSIGFVKEFVEIGGGDCQYFCTKPLECDFQVDSVWLDNCTTDMPIAQLCYYMTRHGATRAFGVCVYDGSMLLSDEGYLPALNARWIVDRPRDLLRVISLDDPSYVWSTTYSSWEQVVRQAAIKFDGKQYFWECIAQHGCFMYYRVTYQEERVECDTRVRFKRAEYGGKECVRFTHYVLRKGSEPYYKSSWQSVETIWPKDLYDKIYKKTMSLPAKDYTMESLRRQLRDYNNTVIISGSAVTEAKFKVVGKSADDGLFAIYMMCYKERFEADKTSEFMRGACKRYEILRSKGLISLSWLLVSEYVRTGVAKAIDFISFPSADFDIAPRVDIMDGYVTYDFVISKNGTKAVAPSVWKSRSNSGFPYPKVRLSGARLLESLRKSKKVSGNLEEITVKSKPISKFNTIMKVGASQASCAMVEADKLVTVEHSGKTKEALDVLLENHDLHFGGVMRFEDVTFDDVPEVLDVYPVKSDGKVLADLQDVADQVHPGLTVNPLSARTYVLHDTDQSISVNAVNNKINTSKMTAPPVVECVESKLRTPVEMDRPQTGLETLLAFNKRNNDAPRLRVPTDPVSAAYDIWDYAKRSGFFVSNCDELLSAWQSKDGMVVPTVDETSRWLSKATTQTVSAVLGCNEESLSDACLNAYQLMIKAQVKPKLDDSVRSEYTALQTVVYHKKMVNALFSPVMSVMAERFLQLFNKKIVIQMRKSTLDMQRAIRKLVQLGGGSDGIKNLEADMSKFDKSQDYVAAELEFLVYKMLGLHPDLLAVWSEACQFGEIASVSVGFRAYVAYQRKSGTATTTLGNTIINVFSVIRGFELVLDERFVYAVFLGDDSLIGYRGLSPNVNSGTDYLAGVMNLQVKVYNTDVGYICSQYVVPDGEGNVVLMSDPVKRIATLGKPIVVKKGVNLRDELFEKWQSFNDLMINYSNPVFRENLDNCVRQRVVTNGSILRGIESLAVIAKDKSKFVSLFNKESIRIIG